MRTLSTSSLSKFMLNCSDSGSTNSPVSASSTPSSRRGSSGGDKGSYVMPVFRLNKLVQTGSFLNGAAPNFGLGVDNISVPSILAKEKLVLNSFSLCFGYDGVGRINFGDKGSSDQGETPFNLSPTYNVSITQIKVGGNAGDLEFNFKSHTSFVFLLVSIFSSTRLYTEFIRWFNNLAQEKLYTSYSSSDNLPFDYCYELSANQTSFKYPVVNLTMNGGDRFSFHEPPVVIPTLGGGLYCLGVVKSDTVNIIVQNFMTGYRIIFDREKMVLGWKASDCYDIETSNTLPVIPPTAVPPAVAVNPEATAGNGNNSGVPGTSSPVTNQSTLLKALSYGLTITHNGNSSSSRD
ncbi:aspartyl protease family protein 1-like [Hibiscus syriacus]|uniref:aspartyl protease family protein 1-like n=1 Tax=Hibiscus syriacus TaxID=106335 RepID=UPI001920951C|nr:aspartyl protease family protein 1-like [Hibiscus syriacus]